MKKSMKKCLFGAFYIGRRLQAPKSWFLAPSGARNQDFENPRLEFSKNPNIISGKLLETTQKSVEKSTKIDFLGLIHSGT